MESELKEIPVPIKPEKYVLNERVRDHRVIKALVVDVETTGISTADSEVIELAAASVEIDVLTFKVLSITPLFDHFKQPTRSKISPKITEITGIRDHMVRGKKLRPHLYLKILKEHDVVLAHNASFDCKFIEAEIPQIKELILFWGCTCHDAKWKSMGFAKKSLGHLVNSSGYKFDAHKAINDVVATSWLLSLYPEALKRIIDFALNDSFKFCVYGRKSFHKAFFSKLGFTHYGNSWKKSYLDPEHLLQEKTKVEEELQKPLTQGKFLITHEDCSSRFVKNI